MAREKHDLRVHARHLRPDSGEAFIADHSVQQERALALSQVGAIFETPSFYEYMSGWQNLRFFVSLSGLETNERLHEVVRLVRLRGTHQRSRAHLQPRHAPAARSGPGPAAEPGIHSPR